MSEGRFEALMDSIINAMIVMIILFTLGFSVYLVVFSFFFVPVMFVAFMLFFALTGVFYYYEIKGEDE